jgi:lipoate-protein ligase A
VAPTGGEAACAERRPAAPTEWTLLRHGPRPAAENMRADEALLLDQSRPGARPVLRFFRWSAPAVTFGRTQDEPSARRWAADRVGAAGLEIVRRPTGGGAVRHHRDLSLSLAWRRDHPAFPRCLRDIYLGFHETVARALRDGGVETAVAGAPARRGGFAVCFEEPTEGDLLMGGRKILGGALRVTSWGRLYQGNLLTDVLPASAAEWEERIAAAFARDYFRAPPAG